MKKHIAHRHNGVPGNKIQLPLLYEANYHDSRTAFMHNWPTRDAFRIHYVREGDYALKISDRESFSRLTPTSTSMPQPASCRSISPIKSR